MIGAQLGPYTIESELGSGGMGTVFRATGPDGPVAVKVIHPHLLATAGFFKRFLREADIGRSVRHDNVVRTFDCDATDVDGKAMHFLVMEYVEGQTLRELLLELERVPEELCRHIGREAARGLAAIHGAGVLHRDLKPENVLVTPDHVVKVMDLGVARLQEETIRLSQTGAFLGSLQYAAPEQFRAGGEADERTDLHALGIVLYELATGQHPYRDEDTSKVIGHILETTPRKAGEINPQLSPFLEEVVDTLMAKDRERRLASAAELVTILDEGEAGTWWKERAKALRLETRRPLRRIRIPRETALYGRDHDLATLESLYGLAREGEGQVLLIEGEAGIGKTRLVDEFVGRIRQRGDDVNFLFGTYPPGGAATASGAFTAAYRDHFGAEDLEMGLGEHLTVTPLLVPAFAALLRGDATPTGEEPLTKDSLQTVFVHATRSLAAERTTIVLIDDLHFAPDAGRALFASLALAIPGHRILLLGTMRPGMPGDWVADVERQEHASHLGVQRLSPKDLAKLLEDAFQSERLATELGHRIALKCDGNPFFAFEIIRGLREGNLIRRKEDGSWVSTRRIEEIEIPSSVLDLVHARVSALTDEERDLLDVACCRGFEFDPTLVAAAAGLDPVVALRRFAQIERRHRLVRSVGRRFAFDHHQVLEGIHASLNELLREHYHAALGAALEQRSVPAGTDHGTLDGALCTDLTRHFLLGGLGQRALPYLDAALRHLEDTYLHADAIALAGTALAAPGLLEGTRRAAVLLKRGKRLGRLGRRKEQAECFDAALALALETEDDSLAADICQHRGWLYEAVSNHDAEAEAFEAALRHARACGNTEAEVASLRGLGTCMARLGRIDEGLPILREALELARRADLPNAEAAVLGGLGVSHHLAGRTEESVEFSRQDLAVSRRVGNRIGESIAASNLASGLARLGLLGEAMEHCERAIELARLVGDRRCEAQSHGNLADVLILCGRHADALKHIERHLDISREIGGRTDVAIALHNRALARAELGEPEVTEADFRAALAGAIDVRYDHLVAGTRVLFGAFLARTGTLDEARELLRTGLAEAEVGEFPDQIVLARALLAAHFGGPVEAAAAALEQYGDRLDPAVRLEAEYLLWWTTGDRARLAEAKRLLDAALDRVPAEYRDSSRRNVRVHREVLAAWEEQGEDEPA